MKSIDFHIHTKKTIKDAPFDFDIKTLVDYCNKLSLDAIAITNHNVFDKSQFEEIKEALPSTIVFPGVEVDLESGHILIISPLEKMEVLNSQCSKLEEEIKTQEDSITYDKFIEIFDNLDDYLLIPHYDKDPKINKLLLEKLQKHILVGEVKNAQKFLITKQNTNMMIPVLFSDNRISSKLLLDESDTEKTKVYMTRKTYIDIDEITIPNLKLCFTNRDNVFLNNDKKDNSFAILPDGTSGRNGLNVILGKRASGKTHVLKSIYKSLNNDSVKYIPQFFISKNSDQDAFDKLVNSKYDIVINEYLTPIKKIMSDIMKIDSISDEKEITDYLSSLKNYAESQAKNNAFSKTKMFNEVLFSEVENKTISEVITSLNLIIENNELKDIIEKHVVIDSLKSLFIELTDKYYTEKKELEIKKITNKIVQTTKKVLSLNAAINPINSIQLSDYISNNKKIERFNSLVFELHKKSKIKDLEEDNCGFIINVERMAFSSADDSKKNSRYKAQYSLKEQFDLYYATNPYKYLYVLKNEVNLPESELYKFITKFNLDITDEKYIPISGGQKAEFILIQQLSDSKNYDMLLIDEPESSFDNPFIKEKIILKLKEIARNIPVFVSTHNNTLGMSISPDLIIYTHRYDNATFDVFTGTFTSENLKSITGKILPIDETLLEVMEAGKVTFEERKKIYENLENRK